MFDKVLDNTQGEAVEVVINGERHLLHTGYTTGACATAAVKGALLALLHQCTLPKVELTIPARKRVLFELVQWEMDERQASCGVVKNGGDDPDATHGALIMASVSFRDRPGICIEGGTGVGRVTKPGLGLDVGSAAINSTPRRMIRQAVEDVLGKALHQLGVDVIISVPGGEDIAKRTMNARLGILGGISILGTTGEVRPFSTSAYKASVVQAVRVAVASGLRKLVLTTGGRTERYAMALYPDLPEEAFIEMGDFLGHAIKCCARSENVRQICLVGMMGKLSKAAAGHLQLHAHADGVDFAFLAEVARETGGEEVLAARIRAANTANQVAEMVREAGNEMFFVRLCQHVCNTVSALIPLSMKVEVILTSMQGEELGRYVKKVCEG